MMRWLLPLVLVRAWMGSAPDLWAAPAPPLDHRYRVEVLAEGMPRPMELEVAPDGRIFFNELEGRLKIYRPATRDVVVAGEIPVFAEQEGGLLGFALDPDFSRTRWIYLFYSPRDYTGARLSRFEMRGDTLDVGSERVVLQFPEQRRDCCHHAGSVEFGPDGTLFISTGDNTHPAGDSDGYAPIDERPDREVYDAQKSSADTADLRGKILRIRPTPEGGYTIPDGNLFPKDGSGGRPEIYVMGCRNPWRMSVDSRTGFVYWGEVGPDAGGDGPRGPRGYDELNQARKAGNFGWPYFIGNNFAYADYDFAKKSVGPRFDPASPTNHSPNRVGARVLPPAQPALIYWPYGESTEFPMLGRGGRTACAGPVFYFQASYRETGGFPEYHDRCLLFYDWQRPFLKWARLDGDSRLAGIEPFTAAVVVANDRDRVAAARSRGQFVIQRPIDSMFGPDGCLYLLDYGETWGANPDSKLIRISYQWGNLAPVAKVSADRTAGREPLVVNLSAAGSMDHDGDQLTYEWRMHPGGGVASTNAEARVTLAEAGNYVAELRVRDDKGEVGIATLPLVAGNTPPEVGFLDPQEGGFFTPGEPVAYALSVRDAEDGSSAEYEEIMGARTFVSATWSRGDGPISALDPGLALMKQSDCFNCHAVEQKVVGPALLDIANRYRGQAEAMEASVQRVIRGSSRVWSEVPMLPHESLHPDQVRLMVRWIYGLEAGKGAAGLVRGLSGSLPVPADKALRFATFEGAYTDVGHGAAGALSGKAVIRLRSRRAEAELADELHGPRVQGSAVGSIDHGHYLRLGRCHLAGTETVTFRVASAGQGGAIELRSGAVDGALLAKVTVVPTGGWDKWVELSAPLAVEGRHDLFVVFLNPGKGGLMNLDWVQFNPGGKATQR